MTATVEETATPDIDWAGEFSGESVQAVPGPLAGSRGTRSSTGTGRGRRSGKAKLESLQKRLSSEMFQAGTLIGLGVPTTGYYICQESDSFTKAVIQLASKRPEWIAALENLADIQPGIIVGRTLVGIGASFAVDRGRADPERQMMKFLGVYSAWYAVNNPEGGPVEGSSYSPPPATYQPVA
jgi:hypothetical protein